MQMNFNMLSSDSGEINQVIQYPLDKRIIEIEKQQKSLLTQGQNTFKDKIAKRFNIQPTKSTKTDNIK